MRKDVFEGLKYVVIDRLIKEYQGSKNVEYREDLKSVINFLDTFLDYNNFLENCDSMFVLNVDSSYIYKIRKIVISSIYSAQIDGIEKNIFLVELTKFFSKCAEPQDVVKTLKRF